MLSRRLFIGAALATPFLARPAFAAADPVFSARGLAIRGTDPVAYFDGNGPVAGDAAHAVMWMNATWHFANADNRAMFESDPAAFAPQYGGYCAYAVSKGYTASTDPEAWSIVDKKLYLNYSLSVRDIWTRDIPGNIAKGDANWPAVLDA